MGIIRAIKSLLGIRKPKRKRRRHRKRKWWKYGEARSFREAKIMTRHLGAEGIKRKRFVKAGKGKHKRWKIYVK